MGAAAALSTALAVHGQNRIVYVDSSAPVGGNGNSWQTAYNDLQLALLLVERPNWTSSYKVEFRIAGGVYKPDLGTGIRDIPLYVQQGDSLIGGFAGRSRPNPDANHPGLFPTTLSGDLNGDDEQGPEHRAENSKQLLRVDPAPLVLASAALLQTLFRNLDFTGAEAGRYGPTAVYCYGHALYTRCVVRDNFANVILAGSGTQTLFGCLLQNNTTGGMLVNGAAAIDNCIIRGNRAADGGGLIYFDSAAAENSVTDSLIVDNYGYRLLLESFASLVLSRCTIAGNATTRSSLISTTSGSLQMQNCIIAENNLPTSRAVAVPCNANTLIGPNVFGRGIADIVATDNPTSCSFGVTPFTDPSPFANRGGADSDLSTWIDNDYAPRTNGPAIDSAQIAAGTDAPARLADVFFNQPVDILSAPNTGTGVSGYIDIGAVEHPALIPDSSCPADFNRSGAVTVQDVFDYLTAYFGGCM